MTKILDVDIDEVSDSQMKIPLRCVLHHWWSQRKYQLILTGWHSLTVSTQCTVGWRNCSDKSSTETHSWLGSNAKRCWSPDGTKKKSDIPGQRETILWPTDPRHSWWRRNRCCGSPEDCHAWTLGSVSVALIPLSERSCPPSQGKGEEMSVTSETEGQTVGDTGGNEGSGSDAMLSLWC